MNKQAKYFAIFGMILLLVVIVLKSVQIHFPFDLDWILMAVGGYLVRHAKKLEKRESSES